MCHYLIISVLSELIIESSFKNIWGLNSNLIELKEEYWYLKFATRLFVIDNNPKIPLVPFLTPFIPRMF